MAVLPILFVLLSSTTLATTMAPLAVIGYIGHFAGKVGLWTGEVGLYPGLVGL